MKAPFEKNFQIFTDAPVANGTTFNQGLTASIGDDGKQYSVIMYSPNLHLIGSLDNTNSPSDSSYSVSVTKGFTFTMGQELSISAEVGVNIEVFTASVTTTFSLSFSESWSKSKTDTITVNCPAHAKSFIYQGTLRSRIMEYDADTGNYGWHNQEGQALTQVLVTRSEPIIDHDGAVPPSIPVTMR